MVIDEKKTLRYVDLAFYFIIMPLMIMFIPTEKWIIHDTLFFITLILYLFGIYFINRKFNIPALLLNGHYTKAIVLIIIMIAITYLLTFYPLNDDIVLLKPEIRHKFRLFTVFLFIIMMSYGLATGLLIELFRQIIYRQSIEDEKNKAEIALYKAQINPHFMFNTLNTLYGLVITQSEKTEDVFIKFSDILQYMYSNSNKDTIPIEMEIDYIRQYIDLQALRLNHYTNVNFNYTIDNNDVQIPPMILITFIENAFKYGASSSKKSIIDISIVLESGYLTFKTKNNVFNNNNINNKGIGVENCCKRLDLLYPNKYTLKLNNKNNIFYVELKIEL